MKITLMDNGPDRPPTVTGGDPPKKKQYDAAPVDPANKELIDWYTLHTSPYGENEEPGQTPRIPYPWNLTEAGPVSQSEPPGTSGGTGYPPIPGYVAQVPHAASRPRFGVHDVARELEDAESRLDEFTRGVDLGKIDPNSPTGQRYIRLKNEVDQARAAYRKVRDSYDAAAGTADLTKLRNSIINRLRRDGVAENLIPQRADQLVDEYQRKFMGYVGE